MSGTPRSPQEGESPVGGEVGEGRPEQSPQATVPTDQRPSPTVFQTPGLHRKYDVRKLNDPGEKHARCSFFVLDIDHDPHARAALLAYADAVKPENPRLWADLILEFGERLGG